MNKGKLHIGTKLVLLTAMSLGDYNKHQGWTIPSDQNLRVTLNLERSVLL